MHLAVRKWAEIQREGQNHGGGKKAWWEYGGNLQETKTKAQKKKEKDAKLKAEGKETKGIR